ncbi:hypothetical protein NKZ03_26095 [Sinorhizobium meliloti]|uniref:hypothetical protein n=1 Tax=Rhizobium meliloti TaxID=382 RepID=UPI003D64B94C
MKVFTTMDELIDPFESPKLLIEGAIEEIEDLRVKCAHFVENCRTIPLEKRDHETGENVIKFRVTDKIPPRLRYTTSNILNNLRHSLDQAINSGAVELGAKKRDSYFPFAKDEDDISAALKSRCKSVDSRLSDYIVSEFNPYGGGDEFLYAVSKVSGPNKHQLTLGLESNLPALVIGDGFGVELTGPGRLGYLAWDSRKQELEFARLGPQAVLKLNGDPRLPIFIAISRSAELGGDAAANVLLNVASKVGDIVEAIERETARLKRL